MEKNDLIGFWVETAEKDYCTMRICIQVKIITGPYLWVT